VEVKRMEDGGGVGGGGGKGGGEGGKEEWVRRLSEEFSKTQFVNEEAEGGQREVQQGDELILLCVHLLHDLEKEAERTFPPSSSSSSSSFSSTTTTLYTLRLRLEAATLLEQALRYSPYNYHFRIALLGVYERLGAGASGVKHFNGLETKQVCPSFPPSLPPSLHSPPSLSCSSTFLIYVYV